MSFDRHPHFFPFFSILIFFYLEKKEEKASKLIPIFRFFLARGFVLQLATLSLLFVIISAFSTISTMCFHSWSPSTGRSVRYRLPLIIAQLPWTCRRCGDGGDGVGGSGGGIAFWSSGDIIV